MLSTPALLAKTDAQKQELAEAMFIQSALIPVFIESTKSDPVQLAQMKMAIAQGAKGFGLDLDKINLTSQGFRPAKKKEPILTPECFEKLEN
jgi:fumarylacetoacetate (FAA) hydrolase family protein